MRKLLTAQALYFAATGTWALVSLSTFETVTGPKTDDWLVKMVGALALVIGIALLAGARAHRRETVVLSVSSAAAFAAVDVIYSLNGTISRIYLADAAVEAALIISVLAARARTRRSAW